jgi:pentapeptide MXKDX repeat protein
VRKHPLPEVVKKDSRRRHPYPKETAMKTTSRLSLLCLVNVLSLGLASAPPAVAQDKMGQEGMNKNGMAKDAMTKDGMKKDDSMSKDGMKKGDAMSKDGMKKDEMKKE